MIPCSLVHLRSDSLAPDGASVTMPRGFGCSHSSKSRRRARLLHAATRHRQTARSGYNGHLRVAPINFRSPVKRRSASFWRPVILLFPWRSQPTRRATGSISDRGLPSSSIGVHGTSSNDRIEDTNALVAEMINAHWCCAIASPSCCLTASIVAVSASFVNASEHARGLIFPLANTIAAVQSLAVSFVISPWAHNLPQP